MLLTQFIRDRSDQELVRLSDEETAWSRIGAYRNPDEDKTEPGCLLCNAFDLRSAREYEDAHRGHKEVELFYMMFSQRNGNDETGAMIARLAQRELGRRAVAPFKNLEPEPALR